MNPASDQQRSLILDIWQSYRSLPGWVQIWVAFVLVPVNVASVAFIEEPLGLWVAVLANIAMVLNLPVMLYERGFSKLMALPHLIPWTLLLLVILVIRPPLTDLYGYYLWVLFAVDFISLVLDYPDAVKWLRGDRAVAGR
ncbi:hypothetical protein IMCC20628_02426 [Hoeflea sp. IMCC20628]|uniref:hypothetical protein n=1 Tax=Hoeflea sp. IMCC20628 TaxID=1620421 RepID=UPI00063AE11C|nr:hypothetical protein [Hoeflea sp. IMCC20628]AKI01124.1 hypothetical protein IMCC20628_02426 [Hoeflea sp. IMCC20628]